MVQARLGVLAVALAFASVAVGCSSAATVEREDASVDGRAGASESHTESHEQSSDHGASTGRSGNESSQKGESSDRSSSSPKRESGSTTESGSGTSSNKESGSSSSHASASDHDAGDHDGGKKHDGGKPKEAGADGTMVEHDAGRDSPGGGGHDASHDSPGGGHDAAHDTGGPPADTGVDSPVDTGVDTGVDSGPQCGPGFAVKCPNGDACTKGSDCVSNYCSSNVCANPPPTCTDGLMDDGKTGLNCGGPNCPACAAGQGCLVPTDCTSLVCTGDICQAPTDSDMVQNDSETGTDCGGALLKNGSVNPNSDGAPGCGTGGGCILGTDCLSLVCYETAITPATASKHGNPINCPSGATCTCQAPSPDDGVQNDSETAIDCGGSASPDSDGAPACGTGVACQFGSDCAQGVCNNNGDTGGGPIDCPLMEGMTGCVCQPPWPNDGVLNDSETDVDCGGSTSPGSDGAPACAPGLMCYLNSDCQSQICVCPGGACGAPGSGITGTCSAPTDTDGVQNDSETDVDCGGTASPTTDGAPPCPDLGKCLVGTDCLSGYCSQISFTCVDGQSCVGLVTPAQIMDPTDTVDGNGDAIGTPDPNGVGQNAGIDTCGTGESTDPTNLQSHESCCKSLLMTTLGACTSDANCAAPETCNTGTGQCEARIDKYEVTSGRVRQFLESLNYDVRDWAIAQFDAHFNPLTFAGQMLAAQMPVTPAGSSVTNALYLLPKSNDPTDPLNAMIETGVIVMDTTGEQGCFTSNPGGMQVGAGGAATYWWDGATMLAVAGPNPPVDPTGTAPRPFTQDMYDIKPQNCMPYYLSAAFCAWDGGRLELQTEHAIIWDSAAQPYPWGAAFLPNPYPGNQSLYTSDPALCGSAATNSAVNCTVDWYDGCQGVGCQGDFYFYPSFPDSIPNNLVPDSLTYSWDESPYIAAPGRFYLDATTVKAASGQTCTTTCPANGQCIAGLCYDSWQDLGADMIEWGAVPAANVLSGSEEMCDQSGVLGAGESYNCTFGLGGDNGMNGVIRGYNLPPADLLGGSWEGHGVQETLIPNWSFYRQYGKTGLRCVRPPEPGQ